MNGYVKLGSEEVTDVGVFGQYKYVPLGFMQNGKFHVATIAVGKHYFFFNQKVKNCSSSSFVRFTIFVSDCCEIFLERNKYLLITVFCFLIFSYGLL